MKFIPIMPIVLIFSLFAKYASATDNLKVGDNAPDFTLQGSDGKTHQLSDFRGKKPVVISWFPKAFTKNCTEQCRSLRLQETALKKADVMFLAVSCNSPRANRSFAENLELNFPVLSDPAGKTATEYGIYNRIRKVSSRVTFFVSKDGKIVHVANNIKVSTHGEDVLTKAKELFK